MGAGAEKLRSDIQTIIAEVERLQILERKAADAIAHAKATEWQRQTASGARIAALRDVESALIGVDFRKAKKADVIEVVRLLAEDARLASPPSTREQSAAALPAATPPGEAGGPGMSKCVTLSKIASETG